MPSDGHGKLQLSKQNLHEVTQLESSAHYGQKEQLGHSSEDESVGLTLRSFKPWIQFISVSHSRQPQNWH